MTPFIEEAQLLLRLARRDYQTFSILRSHPEAPIGSICFHAQQCVEELTRLLMKADMSPPFTSDEFSRLTPAAVELRYDEGIPLLTRDEAGEIATRTLAWAEALVEKAG